MKIVKDHASQTSAAPFIIVNDDGSDLSLEQLEEINKPHWELGNVVTVEESDLVPNPEP